MVKNTENAIERRIRARLVVDVATKPEVAVMFSRVATSSIDSNVGKFFKTKYKIPNKREAVCQEGNAVLFKTFGVLFLVVLLSYAIAYSGGSYKDKFPFSRYFY